VDERAAGAIGAAVQVLGDRWSLLVLRDVIFEDRRYFRALLTGSAEGIASNILADRLVKLVEAGMLARGTAARGQRARYSLTEAGIQTLPIICAFGDWGRRWRPGTARHGAAPGPGDRSDLIAAAMDQLRVRHLGAETPPPAGGEPLDQLKQLYYRTAGDG